MPDTINNMAWGEPILPAVIDLDWEKEVKADMGFVPDLLPRVAPSLWLRQACLKWPRIPVKHFPQQLGDIAALVTAQENACRYCYGVARSYLRAFGHSDKAIAKIERGMQMAELDEQQRVFIRFCRNLARSNPRPPKAERDKLMELGFSQIAVTEMAFHVANHCFINRVSTFISCAPLYKLENMTGSFLGKIMRPLIAKQLRGMAWTDIPPLSENIE
jgi:AhpD family alkylhydroperoxidase